LEAEKVIIKLIKHIW